MSAKKPRLRARTLEAFGEDPCDQEAFNQIREKVARAIHAEHKANEGWDTPWIGLLKYHREKYRRWASAALHAIGIRARKGAK